MFSIAAAEGIPFQTPNISASWLSNSRASVKHTQNSSHQLYLRRELTIFVLSLFLCLIFFQNELCTLDNNLCLVHFVLHIRTKLCANKLGSFLCFWRILDLCQLEKWRLMFDPKQTHSLHRAAALCYNKTLNNKTASPPYKMTGSKNAFREKKIENKTNYLQ